RGKMRLLSLFRCFKLCIGVLALPILLLMMLPNNKGIEEMFEPFQEKFMKFKNAESRYADKKGDSSKEITNTSEYISNPFTLDSNEQIGINKTDMEPNGIKESVRVAMTARPFNLNVS
ncbi:unnamed protein product, partial [Meganyctiphanes norvegica]